MRLYEIANEYRVLDALLDESGGEITPEIEARLAALPGELNAKIDGICALVRQRDGAADMLMLEANRLRDRAKAIENSNDSLRLYLRHCLEVAGLDKVKTERNTVWQATASQPTIRWTGEGDPPQAFTRTKIELDGRICQYRLKVAGGLPDGFTVERTKYLGMR